MHHTSNCMNQQPVVRSLQYHKSQSHVGPLILHRVQSLYELKSSVVREKGRSGRISGIGNVTLTTKHFVVECAEDGKIIRGFAIPDFQDLGVSVSHIPRTFRGLQRRIREFQLVILKRFESIVYVVSVNPKAANLTGIQQSVAGETKYLKLFGSG